jgi:hypothetical protein
MSIPLFNRMSRPAPLLFGNQQATLFSVGFWIVLSTIQLVTPLMAVIFFCLSQVYVFSKTRKNLYFFEEKIISSTSKNNKAKLKGVETYV